MCTFYQKNRTWNRAFTWYDELMATLVFQTKGTKLEKISNFDADQWRTLWGLSRTKVFCSKTIKINNAFN